MQTLPRTVSPQGKLINVSDKFGNRAVQFQQGTTREIYDSIAINGQTEFIFFEGVGSRPFPLSNLDQNQLTALETLAIDTIYFSIIEIDPATGEILSVTPLEDADINIQLGDWQFEHAEGIKAKRLPLLSQVSQFNYGADFVGQNAYPMRTILTIQPNLSFSFKLRTPFGVTIVNSFLRMTVGGVGTLIAPKATT